MPDSPAFSPVCPVPVSDYRTIVPAHGGGGRMMQRLITQVFRAAFDDLGLQADCDAATLLTPGARLAFTTDSFVVHPLFFPGGDIGALAVFGTVNDLAMIGARPYALSVSFILEEGLPVETLWRIVVSMREAAQLAGVRIVTGDTKVVDRGKADGVFINTSGIGLLEYPLTIVPSSARPGDRILVSGDLGRHGIAVMASREGLAFETEIESDAAPLFELVASLLDAGISIHTLRDLTRGGLTSALHEIATSAGVGILLDESQIPVSDAVHAACEMLGFDPLYVANEGRFVAIVPAEEADRALEILREHPDGSGAACIGDLSAEYPGIIRLKTLVGSERIVDLLSGEQLPRIC